MQSPTVRRISFTFPDEQISPRLISKGSNRSAGSGSLLNSSITGPGVGASGPIMPDRQGGVSGTGISNGNSNNNANNNGFHNGANFPHHSSSQQQQPLLVQDQPQARMPKELTCISEEGIVVEQHGPM